MFQEKIKQSYLYTDIEPTFDRLNKILTVAQNFEKEGADRLTCALNTKHMDIHEVRRLAEYIGQAREKMEKELARVHEFEKDFNLSFATDHNNYFNSVSEILSHVRSHMSPLKYIFKKFCYRNHPNKNEVIQYSIPRQSVFDKSILSTGEYQPDIFDISDYPIEVQGLFTEMQKFFNAEAECMKICTELLEEEARIAKDPVHSKYLLDNYRRKAYKRLKNQIVLFSEDIIDKLKLLCPAYQRYQDYASEEGFAQGEYHKHNTADMDHFHLIEIISAKYENSLTSEELANWDNKPELVKKIKYVIEHFDELLPDDFNQKKMGEYQYYFCKWALPDNIKAGTSYFIKHYKGKWKVSKYGAVNSHGSKYNQHSEEVKNFLSAIQNLLIKANMTEMKVCSA